MSNIMEAVYSFKKRIIEYYINNIVSDRKYLEYVFLKKTGMRLNLDQPETYNDKLNFLKLYDRKPIYTIYADKYRVRDIIEERIGGNYLVPLLGVWDDVETINFSSLPPKYVLKCNHDNGVIVCQDKSTADIGKIKQELAYRLKRDFYKRGREWPYKNIKRKIICEQFMENEDGTPAKDYKVSCFNGVPKIINVTEDRINHSDNPSIDIYDIEWNYLGIQLGKHPLSGNIHAKPSMLSEMLELSSVLSQNIPFLRVDFNCWNNRIYFSELTFFTDAGFGKFTPDKWNKIIGSWIDISTLTHG